MKNIGIFFGAEKSFPEELIQYINKQSKTINASSALIGAVNNIDEVPYDIIYDRISHYVPMYKSYLKMAQYKGTKVVNSPHTNCIDNNFFNTVLAYKSKLNIPKTVLLPSKELPDGINSEHLHNLIYPINWEEVFEYIGFPAILKPNKGYNLYNSYKVYNPSEFFSAYDLTGKQTMILQQSVDYDSYYRAFAVGKDKVRIVAYNPIKPIHLRYNLFETKLNSKLEMEMKQVTLYLSEYFNLYFNSVEFAIKDGIPYIASFINPAPKCEQELLWEEDFRWLVETTGDMLINL